MRAEPPREILEEHLLPFVYYVSSLTVVVSYMCSMVFFGWEAPSISKHVDFHSRFFCQLDKIKDLEAVSWLNFHQRHSWM